MKMKTQYVTDDNGKKVAVIIPFTEYEKLMDDVDELDAIKAYDKARSRKLEFAPAEEVFKSIEHKRKR